jgi:hypothetical protein
MYTMGFYWLHKVSIRELTQLEVGSFGKEWATRITWLSGKP